MMRQIIIRRRRRRPLCNLLLLVVILLCSFVPSFGRIVDPYKTLGVSRNSSQKDIQKRYRELCLKYHPDKNVQKPTKEREKFEGYFKQVQQAYDMIGSAESRQQQNFQQRYGGSTTSSQGQRSSPFGSDPLSEAAFRAFATGDRSFFTRGMGSGGGGGGPSFGIRTPFPSRGAQSPMMPTNLNFKSIYIQKVEIDLETLYKGVTSFRFELRDNLWTRYRAAIRGKVILLSIYQGMMYSFPVLRASKLLAAVIGLCVVHVTLPRPDPQASYAATLKKGTKYVDVE
jgi:curved DNA-binding protein CbpA